MKVQIGDLVFSDLDVPILVLLTETDKKNIANMLQECSVYASFPEGNDIDEIHDKMLKLKE